MKKRLLKSILGAFAVTVTICGLTACKNDNTKKPEEQEQDVLNQISVSGGKKDFTVGENFTVGDLVVKATYSVSGEKTITDYQVDSSKVNKDAEGSYEITVSYNGKTATYNVTYRMADTLTGISVSGGKKDFTVGEDFTVGDLVVKATYSVSGEKTITDYQVDSSKVNKDAEGSYEITVSYNGKTATYNVTYRIPEIIYEGFKLLEVEGGYSIQATADYDYAKKLTLPSEYEGKPIIEIASSGMTDLKVAELIIPSSIKKIGDNAFIGNSYIGIVDMSACSAEIGAGAFYGCGLYAIDLGSVTKIGTDAFAESELCTLFIPATVLTIGDNAFNTLYLEDVTFGGNTFPELGLTVFGERATSDESIYLYAKETAWNNLFENIAEENQPEFVQLYFQVTYGGYYNITDEEIAQVGIYRGDATVYMNVGDQACILVDDYITSVFVNSTKGLIFTNDENERFVLALDEQNKTVERLTPNANGEYIKDNALYDYVGTSVIYNVPDSIVEVIGGAGNDNLYLRFVNFGENLKTIGDFAFSNGYLFGITFEENIESIGSMAFFGQEYLQEIIFKGTTAPVIGTAAFCYIDRIGIIPTMYANSVSGFANPKIYTPLTTSDDWWTGAPAGVTPFVEAFNASLTDIGDALVKDEDGDFVEYTAGYSGNFGQLKTSGLYASGKIYTSDLYTIYMSGVENGYAMVELKENDYDGLGSYSGFGYAHIGQLAGYKDEESPKKIQIFFAFGENGIRDFTIFASFDTTENTLTLRGAEAGNFGIHNGQVIELDGYGTITYYTQTGATHKGTYEIEDNKITVDGIPGITELTYIPATDTTAASVQIEETTLPTLGVESGIYYDYANHAKLELDGTQITVGGTTYSGTLYLDFKGQTITERYILENNYIKFSLNDTAKEWSFSKDSKTIVSGYVGNYEDYLEFSVAVVSSNAGTYTNTNGNETLTLDGYFTANYNGTSVYYTEIAKSNTVVLFTDNEATIVYLDSTGHTYSEADTSTEAGTYYVGSSVNYTLYLDGKGNLLYFDGSNKFGTYTYDSESKEIIITSWNSETNTPTLNGVLQNNSGYIVYSSYGSDSFLAISKTPFVQITNSWGSVNQYMNTTLYYFTPTTDGYESKTASLYIYITGNTLLINVYGKPFEIITLDSIADNTVVPIQFTQFEPRELDITITLHIKDDAYSATVEGPYQHETVKKDTDEYQMIWLDSEKTTLAFFKIESYPTVNIYTVNWNTEQTEFSFGESGQYVVSNYGTTDMTLTITE